MAGLFGDQRQQDQAQIALIEHARRPAAHMMVIAEAVTAPAAATTAEPAVRTARSVVAVREMMSMMVSSEHV